ncbi:FAD-dependent oxidoreductase [Phenylobacterium sp.]|uniref:NAD(P)/FAD-dependent oxidoreductase n=1 Tax=Phenylobacterium sp. TaxID=1871053 RepID=UPI00301C339C
MNAPHTISSAPGPGSGSPYADTSFWMQTADDDLTPRPALKGDLVVDVAIMGGGYSGLWTAYYLLLDNPALEVAVIERDICGFGASGRNGGWCSSRYPLYPETLERRFGPELARRTLLEMFDAVEEIGRICEREGIDAHYRNTGILSVARGRDQLPAIQAAHAAYARLGLDDRNLLIGPEAARERINVTKLEGALYTPVSASVHPARLARGLARAVERRGGVIYEQSAVTGITRGPRPALSTASGRVQARRAVVTAGEAYLPQLAPFRRSRLPMSSMIVLTAPLTAAQWDEIGWAQGESLGSQAHTVDYLTKTLDGRILYGSRGAPYHWGSRLDETRDREAIGWMQEAVVNWFPSLRGVEFTHAWGGYLGVSRDWSPGVTFDPATRLGNLGGYTGRGVSTSNLSARLLAGLITGRETGLETLPLAQHQPPAWEPEPFRWLGVRYVQDAFRRIDQAAEDGRPPPFDTAFAHQLSEQ